MVIEYHGLNLKDDNKNIIKVRAVNTDMKRGASDGYRIIYYAIKNEETIFLLTIYSKKDDNKIPTNEEIKYIVNQFVSEYEI